MSPKHIRLQPSESVIAQGACQIYAAYIASGQVETKDEATWMKKAIREAIMIAQGVDDAVISDDEVDGITGLDSPVGRG